MGAELSTNCAGDFDRAAVNAPPKPPAAELPASVLLAIVTVRGRCKCRRRMRCRASLTRLNLSALSSVRQMRRSAQKTPGCTADGDHTSTAIKRGIGDNQLRAERDHAAEVEGDGIHAASCRAARNSGVGVCRGDGVPQGAIARADGVGIAVDNDHRRHRPVGHPHHKRHGHADPDQTHERATGDSGCAERLPCHTPTLVLRVNLPPERWGNPPWA